MVEDNSERQARTERLLDDGHSMAHSVGASWAMDDPDFTAPPEHGVDPAGVLEPGIPPAA